MLLQCNNYIHNLRSQLAVVSEGTCLKQVLVTLCERRGPCERIGISQLVVTAYAQITLRSKAIGPMKRRADDKPRCWEMNIQKP